MEKAAALAVFSLFLLVAGCTGEKPQNPPAMNGTQAAPNLFSFPGSPVEFSATYKVSEAGAEAVKKVWASGNRMRIDVSDGGEGLFSLYFLGNSAYSCTRVAGNASCFDVSGRAGSIPSGIFPCQDLSGAAFEGEVGIGNTLGRCYSIPYGVFSKRKICCTDRGVLAYDEYNVTSGNTHVEYLTDIYYSASDSDFLLPAEPMAAPEE
ncbi:TPA: hypothetical protein HA243_04690 [Candidatus Micrarchaeota archaeon]|nr:hypothetical protein [Candidatus Micrarchaeota archaeon]